MANYLLFKLSFPERFSQTVNTTDLTDQFVSNNQFIFIRLIHMFHPETNESV